MANKILEGYRRRFGVCIVDDSFFDPWTGAYKKRYKVYSADGNKWENGMTWKRLRTMFKEDADALLAIKEGYEAHLKKVGEF